MVPPFLTSALDGDEWPASRLTRSPQRKNAPYPLHMRLAGPQSRSERYGERKNLLPFPGTEHRLLGRPASNLVTINHMNKLQNLSDLLSYIASSGAPFSSKRLIFLLGNMNRGCM
jgi:hypothetical protein